MPPTTARKRIVFKYGTAEEWIEKNPILLAGEPGVESDTNLVKIGDGDTRWTDLPYINAVSGESIAIEVQNLLAYHINVDPTPHPVYDDGPSLALLYANAKV